jgi:hypothetical protein
MVNRQAEDELNLKLGGRTGIFKRVFNQTTSVNGESQQLAPKDAN